MAFNINFGSFRFGNRSRYVHEGTHGSPLWALILLLPGIPLTIWGYYSWKSAKESLDWPTVPGKVLSSTVREEEKRTKDSSGRWRYRTHYSADVRYNYTVEGKTFTSDNVTITKSSSTSRGSAADCVNRYPEGSEVQVHYNPEDPSTSVLEPGLTWGNYLLLGIGLLFTALGLLVPVLGTVFKSPDEGGPPSPDEPEQAAA